MLKFSLDGSTRTKCKSKGVCFNVKPGTSLDKQSIYGTRVTRKWYLVAFDGSTRAKC